MKELISAISSALWLGILTSISSCPLAANIAAVSYLSKKIIHILQHQNKICINREVV